MPKLSPEDHLKFAAQVLETQIFGAFWLAIEARRKEEGLTQAQLAERTGRDKTNISKLLDGPRNWTIKTISDLSEALGVRFMMYLEDKIRPQREFTPTGVVYTGIEPVTFSGFADPLAQMSTGSTIGSTGLTGNVVTAWSGGTLGYNQDFLLIPPGQPIAGTLDQVDFYRPTPARQYHEVRLAG